MTVEQKQLIQMHFNILRQMMEKEGLVFGIVVNKKDYDNSALAIMDKNSAIGGNFSGISINLKDLNRGLV